MAIENNRILSRQDLAKKVDEIRRQGKTIVLTNGCFDILHVGHLHLLNKAKAFGDILIVGLNSDMSVAKLKGKERPVVDEKERAEIVANLQAVDYVSIFDEETAIELIKTARPDIYVKGGDYNLSNLPEAETVQTFGGKVEFIEYMPRKSTTALIDKIKTL